MIRLEGVKVPVEHTENDLKILAAKKLGVKTKDIAGLTLARKSIDARKKPSIYYVYSLDINVPGLEEALLKKGKAKAHQEIPYQLPQVAYGSPAHRGGRWAVRTLRRLDTSRGRLSPAHF